MELKTSFRLNATEIEHHSDELTNYLNYRKHNSLFKLVEHLLSQGFISEKEVYVYQNREGEIHQSNKKCNLVGYELLYMDTILSIDVKPNN